jgi:hypothetical protein
MWIPSQLMNAAVVENWGNEISLAANSIRVIGAVVPA